jgi:hypothetical protein
MYIISYYTIIDFTCLLEYVYMYKLKTYIYTYIHTYTLVKNFFCKFLSPSRSPVVFWFFPGYDLTEGSLEVPSFSVTTRCKTKVLTGQTPKAMPCTQEMVFFGEKNGVIFLVVMLGISWGYTGIYFKQTFFKMGGPWSDYPDYPSMCLGGWERSSRRKAGSSFGF